MTAEAGVSLSGGAVEVRVRHCPRADREHRASRRQYAHVGHVRRVVCIARAFWRLPRRHQRGVLFHELGHLALGPRRHSEAAADRAAHRHYDVHIRYRSSARWGERLEYV